MVAIDAIVPIVSIVPINDITLITSKNENSNRNN